MEFSSPKPQDFGNEFVNQYYTALKEKPTDLHKFYDETSSFVHGSRSSTTKVPPVVGVDNIMSRIKELKFRDCQVAINQVDSQVTVGDGVVVQVTGRFSSGGAPMQRFTHTAILVKKGSKYFLFNDMFQYHNILQEPVKKSSSYIKPMEVSK